MAIQISGCTVIDNSRNITNANNMCVGVVTMTGSTGNIETPGTITAGGLDFPPSVISFDPSDGATEVEPDSNIIIAFDQLIQKATTGIGTTANITLRNSSGIGTVIQTIGVASTSVSINGSLVTINPPSNLPGSTNVYVVIDASAFNSSGGNSSLINTYDFTIRDLELGDSFEGGFIICESASVYWIVAPNTSEVSRDWYSRDDASTRAQQVSGCTGWFVPSCGQLQNPGYTCRDFWDFYCCTNYWSDSTVVTCANFFGFQFPDFTTVYTSGVRLDFTSGSTSAIYARDTTHCVRSFRCVTY
jgi:hypothetical protein